MIVGSVRALLPGVACALILALPPSRAADKPDAAPKDADAASKADRARMFALPDEDPPREFVPLHPRTVEKQREIEAVRDYGVARALEDQHAWNESIALLEEAIKLDPDSIAVLRRLSRLCFLLKKPEQALKYSRQVLEADPGDTETISRLVAYYTQKNDSSDIEAILKDVLANPKLDKNAPGRLLADYELGKLYAGRLHRIDKAADAFARVVDALDHKTANRLSPIDQQRILGGDESETYLEFGDVFLEAKRYDRAIQAYRLGLVYNEEHPLLPLRLAETLLKTGKPEEALALVTRFLKRQPQGSEGYELQAKILTALKREGEITPLLEEAARADSKNLPLQYALADRYREVGQVEKAEELYKTLLAQQPTPQGYGALAASLLKRKKTEELIKVLTEAVPKPGGFEAVRPQLDAILKDPTYADEVLDVGLKLLKDPPADLDQRIAMTILSSIANDAGKSDPVKLEKLLAIQRLALKQNPNPLAYREVADCQIRLKKYDDAAATIEELMANFPVERSSRLLLSLAQIRRDAGKIDSALAAVREAIKLDPNDDGAQVYLCLLLSQDGKPDEAVAVARTALKVDPANPMFNRLLGNILTQYGRDDEAIALYKGLLERYPNNEEVVRLARSGLSVVYVNQGDYAKGEAELENLLQREPDDPGVNNDLGYLYADQGKNLEKAEAMIRKALQEEPKSSPYLDSLGWVLFKSGKVKEAVEPLEQAIENMTPGGGDATIHEHLGDVYFRLQEYAKARAAWEKAEKAGAKASPPDKRLPEIRKKLETLGKLAPEPKPASSDTP
jgi:tetratricopeptide (TPR) repeat protein